MQSVPTDLQDSFIFDAWDALGTFEAATAKLEGDFEPTLVKELSVVVHRLKGTAALYHYPQISRLAELAERLLEQSSRLPAAETVRVRAFLEKVAVCLQDALTRIASGKSEGNLGLELSYLGGASLLQQLLRENREAFRQSEKAKRADGPVRERTLSGTLRTFFSQHRDDWTFFAPEVLEHLEVIADTLSAVRQGGANPDLLTALFRSTHTLKGAAYMVGLTPMGDLAHLLEDLMAEVREGNTPFDGEAQRALQEGVQALALMIPAAEGKATEVDRATREARVRLQTHLGLEPDPEPTPATGEDAPVAEPEAAVPPEADIVADLRAFYRDAHESWNYFAPEVRGGVDTMRAATAAVTAAFTAAAAETGPEQRDAQVSAIFRAAHTLKGAAATVGCPVMPDVALRIERLMIEVREQGLPFDAAVAEAVMTGSAVLEQLLAAAEGQDPPLKATLATFNELEPLATGAEASADAAPGAAATDNAATNAAASAVINNAVINNTVINGRPQAPSVTIRVGLSKLDTLMTLSNELVASRSRLDRLLGELGGLTGLLDASRSRLGRTVSEFEERYLNPRLQATALRRVAPSRTDAAENTLRASLSERFDELEFDSYSDLNILARSVAEMASDLSEVQGQFSRLETLLREETGGVEALTRSLRSEVGRARMVAVRGLFGRLRRLVSEVPDKSYTFKVSGEAVEVDNVILEGVADPLLHLVKNAAVHGVESEAVRVAAGKPAVGTVSVSARHRGNRVYIEVADDGRGIDAEAVKAKALERGLISPEALAKLTPQEVLELIFLPGLSTAAEVTTEAGRGVGMDAVASNIARLKGEVEIDSEPGRGTRFTLSLPLTLIVTEVLLLKVGDERMAVPADAVQVLRALPRTDLREHHVVVDGQMTEYHDLRALFGLPESDAETLQVALLDTGDARVALGVDGFLELEEVVVRGLEAPLQALSHLAGAAVSSRGDVVLILDPAGVRRLSATAPVARRGAATQTAPVSAGHLLLVDDSISVRKVVSKMLLRAGYEVTTAADGVEALMLLRDTGFDAVITDLEMPRMSGYELLEEVRRKPEFADLPLLVVTTRAGEKHTQLAFELGASDYLTKPVDETKLLRFLAHSLRARLGAFRVKAQT